MVDVVLSNQLRFPDPVLLLRLKLRTAALSCNSVTKNQVKQICLFERYQTETSDIARFCQLNPHRNRTDLGWLCIGEEFNLLATDFFFQILAHPVFKM